MLNLFFVLSDCFRFQNVQKSATRRPFRHFFKGVLRYRYVSKLFTDKIYNCTLCLNKIRLGTFSLRTVREFKKIKKRELFEKKINLLFVKIKQKKINMYNMLHQKRTVWNFFTVSPKWGGGGGSYAAPTVCISPNCNWKKPNEKNCKYFFRGSVFLKSNGEL